MRRKLLISLGSIAAGLAWSGGYAQASDLSQDVTTSQPFEVAQSAGSGGSTGGGTTSGGNSSGMARGNTGSNNMNTGNGRERIIGHGRKRRGRHWRQVVNGSLRHPLPISIILPNRSSKF